MLGQMLCQMLGQMLGQMRGQMLGQMRGQMLGLVCGLETWTIPVCRMVDDEKPVTLET